MSGRRVLTCLLCDNDVSVKKLLEHICGHIQYAPQKCGDCNFKSAEPSDLLQHTLDTGHVGNPSIDPYKELLLDSISKDIQFATEHGVEELVKKKKKKKFVPDNVESLAGATVASNPEEAKKTTTEVKSEVKEEVKEEPRISGYDEGSVDQSGAHGRGDRPMPVTSTANNVNFNAKFGVNNAAPPTGQPLNELTYSQGNNVDSEMMGDDMNMEDPIMDDRNSTPIEEESLNNVSSNSENVDESSHNEMIGKANDSMEEKGEKDGTVHQTSDILKDSTETHGLEKKMRPKRSQSGPVKYTEFFDESEPPAKKPNIVELECPNCEYRSESAVGWYLHLKYSHSTTPRKLGLALLCECGNKSFTAHHIRKCKNSKCTVVRKNATPQCVMCEVYPKTPLGYACHLEIHHKTTLPKMGIFLTCSCNLKVYQKTYDSGHSKKCNGHEFTLHKLDEE